MTTNLIGEGISGDKSVGELEKELGLPPGTVRNRNSRDTRSDKKVSTLRREMQPRPLHRRLKRRRRTPEQDLQESLPLKAPVTLEDGEQGEITPLKEAVGNK